MIPPPDESSFAESNLFENAFNHAAIGMALVGLDGHFLKVNKSLCDLVGYPEVELREKTFQDITHPEDLESDLAQLRRLVAGEITSYKLEKRYFTKSSAIVWILLSVSLVKNANGEPQFSIAQIQDITRAKEAQEARDELLGELQRSSAEITNLRSKLLTICAWTKRVRCRDQWMTVDEFLTTELGLNLTHGMSAEAEAQFLRGGFDMGG
jgi:PAS domain S-box-containing protein